LQLMQIYGRFRPCYNIYWNAFLKIYSFCKYILIFFFTLAPFFQSCLFLLAF
jgi:hypothetical protein